MVARLVFRRAVESGIRSGHLRRRQRAFDDEICGRRAAQRQTLPPGMQRPQPGTSNKHTVPRRLGDGATATHSLRHRRGSAAAHPSLTLAAERRATAAAAAAAAWRRPDAPLEGRPPCGATCHDSRCAAAGARCHAFPIPSQAGSEFDPHTSVTQQSQNNADFRNFPREKESDTRWSEG